MTIPDPTHPESDPLDAPAPVKHRRLVDLAPLRTNPVFARLWIGSLISGIGAQMSIVAVGLQIYAMTRSTFAVGLVGGIALVPMIVAGLWGGMIADVFDRRRVLMVASLIGWAGTLSLVAMSTWDAVLTRDGAHAPLWPFYVATTITAVAATIRSATNGAVVGRIVPSDMISRATALNGISFGAMLTIGPAFAGVLAATVGLPWTFAADAVLFTAGFLGIWMLPALPRAGERVQAGWGVLREGLDLSDARPEHPHEFHRRYRRHDVRPPLRAVPRARRDGGGRRVAHRWRADGRRRCWHHPDQPVLRTGRACPPPRRGDLEGDHRVRRFRRFLWRGDPRHDGAATTSRRQAGEASIGQR